MKFDKILGKCDPKLVLEAEDKLSSIFTELAMSYKTKAFGSKLGGDVFLHQLVSPLKHICDARGLEFDLECEKLKKEFDANKTEQSKQNEIIQGIKNALGKQLLYTAATNGKMYFWAPQFIVKQSKIGLRLIVGHEGWHTIYMHPTRRGSRNPGLWNIAVDFKVNFTLMDDLRLRDIYRAEEVFKQELGDFITLNEYASFLKDPFNPPEKLALWNPIHSLKQAINPGYRDANDKSPKSLYYAEPKLADDMRQPEMIYEYLLSQVPKCSCCGKVGVWKKPKEYQDLEKQAQEMQKEQEAHQHEHS